MFCRSLSAWGCSRKKQAFISFQMCWKFKMLPKKQSQSCGMLPPTFHICRADAWGDVSSAEVGARTRQRERKNVCLGGGRKTDVTVSMALIMQCGWIGEGGVVAVVVVLAVRTASTLLVCVASRWRAAASGGNRWQRRCRWSPASKHSAGVLQRDTSRRFIIGAGGEEDFKAPVCKNWLGFWLFLIAKSLTY